MAPRVVSLALAAGTLAGALWLHTRSLWVWGPFLYFPFVGAPAVAGMMTLRPAIVRRLGGGPDATARALEVVALATMLLPGAGLFVVWFLSDIGGRCGLQDARAALTALGASSPLWLVGEVVVLGALSVRRSTLARLRRYQVVATVLALVAAPPLAVLACIATGFESIHGGGAAVVVLLPAAIAAGATAVAWTLGRSFATGTALRRVAAALLALAAGVSVVLSSRTPLPRTCESFSTTATWGLLAEVGWAACPCLAVVLYFAHDPVVPAAT